MVIGKRKVRFDLGNNDSDDHSIVRDNKEDTGVIFRDTSLNETTGLN